MLDIRTAVSVVAMGLLIIFGFGVHLESRVSAFFTILGGLVISSVGIFLIWVVFKQHEDDSHS